MTLEDAAWNHFRSLKTNRPGMKDRISMYSSKRVVTTPLICGCQASVARAIFIGEMSVDGH